MAENIVLGSFSTLQNSSIIATLNANNGILTTALADCLSLSGTQPNQMLANLDMNSQQIINLPAPATLNSPVRVGDLTASTSSLSPALFALLAANNVFTGIQTFSNSTQSTSTTTGALVVSGGLGIAKNLFVGGSLNVGSFSSSVIAGGINAGSTLTLESTSNVSPSGDTISVQGSKIFFKSATGASTFGDYNNTTSSTWTFTGNVTVSGNLSVTGSSSTFSFSGSNLGLGTATPATHAGFATLTTNGTTGGSSDFQTAGATAVRIFNNGAANLTHSLTSAAGTYLFYVNTLTTLVLDYNTTNVNAWTFSKPVFITGNNLTVTGLATFTTLAVVGGASNIAISGSSITGSTTATAGLTLISTSSGAPTTDFITTQATRLAFKTASGGTIYGDFGVATANTWTFSGTAGVVINTATGTMLNVSSANTGASNNINFTNSGTGSTPSTAASLVAALSSIASCSMTVQVLGGATPVGRIFTLSGVTGGITFISTAGPIVYNAFSSSQFQSNSVGIGDFGLTTANAWTFRGSGGVIIDTVVGTMMNVTSANTSSINSIIVNNSGTVATAGTAAQLIVSLSGGANVSITNAIVGGASPKGLLQTASGVIAGFSIVSLAGPILFNAATSLQFQSSSGAVGDYGLTTAGTWTFVNPFVINAGTLGNGVSALTLTATQPTTPVAAQNAINITITSAGSAAQANRGLFLTYAAGYTGGSPVYGLGVISNAATTGIFSISAAGTNNVTGNIGIVGSGGANGTGSNTGVAGFGGGTGGGSINVGVFGTSQLAVNSATNIGIVGTAVNTGTSPVMVGGWFSLNQTTIPTVSAALIADNGAQSQPVALFRVNGTTVSSFNSSGLFSMTGGTNPIVTTTSAITSGGAATSPTLGAGGPAGATTPTKWVPINDNGTTRYFPVW